MGTTKAQAFQGCSDQINAFVIIHSLEIIIAKLAACNVSVIWLVSVAEQTSLSLNWFETMRPIL